MNNSFFNSRPGRILTALFAFDLLSIGLAAMVGSELLHTWILAISPMVTIAAMIVTVGLTTIERPPLDALWMVLLGWIPGAAYVNTLTVANTLGSTMGILFILAAAALTGHALLAHKVYGVQQPAQPAAA